MLATSSIAETRKFCDEARMEGKRVGFVPTMGALHDGHRSLIRRAREQAHVVVVSIFVNPTQFGEGEDLDNYPRTFAVDLEACKEEGADIVFHPHAADIYPPGAETTVRVGGSTSTLEGEHRPTHFDGVALVCTKLFNIVGACTAFFGQKDAQQVYVIERLVADLMLPIDVVACPTVRNTDGLALSSRNVYLDRTERDRALALSRALHAMERVAGDGETDAERLVGAGMAVLEASGVDAVDYLVVVDAATFSPTGQIDGPAIACGAVRIGNTRLIDNVSVGEEKEER